MKSIELMNRLYDFYGGLLTKNQGDAFSLYYLEDLSLSEISELMNMTRQGVYDNIKRAEKKLTELEQKLGLVARFDSNENALIELKTLLTTTDYKYDRHIEKAIMILDSIIDNREVIDSGI